MKNLFFIVNNNIIDSNSLIVYIYSVNYVVDDYKL